MRRVFASDICSSSTRNSKHSQDLSNERCLDQALDDLLDPPSTSAHAFHHSLYLPLLKACIKLKALPQAQRINTHLSYNFPSLSPFLVENLILTLARCGGLDDALTLFHSLSQKSVFSWTAIIAGFADYGHAPEALCMHQCMLNEGFEPDAYTYVSLFKACGAVSDLDTGRKLHETARSKGFTSVMVVLTALLSMYAKCGALDEAKGIFCCLPQPDVVSWNAMLSAYVEHGEGENALLLYLQMNEEGMEPTHQTMVIALQACGVIAEGGDCEAAMEIGQALHSHARNKGFVSHVFVHTTLVSMYGKCAKIKEAENVFIEQLQHHLSLWNALLSAYVEQGCTEKGLQLFKQMLSEGISPDERTYVVTLQACVTCMERDSEEKVKPSSTRFWCLEIGEALHADLEVGKFTSDVFVGTTLLSLYGTCGLIAKAEAVFGELSHHTAVAWNALLCAYIEGSQAERVVELYKKMQLNYVPLDATSLLCLLQACSEVGILDFCLQLHFAVVSLEQDYNLLVRSALVHAYGGCASIEDAELVFHCFPQLDLASWNACMAGYAMEGNITASAHSFDLIHLVGFIADGVTYASVISACNHAGLVQSAFEYFVSMGTIHGILPDSKHLVSITDLLGRAGDFLRLEDIVQRKWKHADLTMWLFLLGACRTHGNVELAKQVFEYAVDVEPEQATVYVSMSNIYADVGATPEFFNLPDWEMK